MANVQQIYEVVNSLLSQSLGDKAIEVTDASWVNVGKLVLSTEDNIDAFYKTLVDRIGRTVLAVREYKADIADMVREPFAYGAILQKISFKMPSAQENQTWDSLDTSPEPNPFEKMPMEFMQVFFDKWTTWETGATIPDVQLETAFTNATAMAAFIDGIFMSMYNSMELAYENTGNMARATLIGQTVNTSTVSTQVVKLVTEYNTETSSTLTPQQAKTDTGFLKYASMRMKLISDNMEKFSDTFNTANWQRHTTKDRQVFELLSVFEGIFDTYLQADTFHNELTKLKGYKSVPYWQGSGTAWDFDSVSSIKLTIPVRGADGAETTATVQQSNIIAVIRDIDSVGITIDKRRTKSQYNPKGEYTNYWIKADMGYFVDGSENCTVFLLA